MEPNKQTGEKPCSILKNSKTLSQSEYLPSPSTETILKRVSFSTKKLVKKFDQHGELNSSCESSDMSTVSPNCSIKGIIQRIPIFHDDTNVSLNEPTTISEFQSLKRSINHIGEENLKKCKFDFEEADNDKENVMGAEMSMTCVLPSSVYPCEKEIENSNRQKTDDNRTELFCNEEMEMSLTKNVRPDSQIEPRSSENVVNLVPSLNLRSESDISSMDMSMTLAVPSKFRANSQVIEGLSHVSESQCPSVLPEPVNQLFEMNMSLTCAVPSGAESPLTQAIAEESQRTLTKFLQKVESIGSKELRESFSSQSDQYIEENMSMTCAVKPIFSNVTEEASHDLNETMGNNCQEETNDQSFDANMSETCAVPSNIYAAKEMTSNELKSHSNLGIKKCIPEEIAENVEIEINSNSLAIDLPLNMNVSIDSLTDTNNFANSLKVRASSCLNNNMDGSFLKTLAEENRDLLTDEKSLLANMEDPLADEEQLDDIEEPPTFMSGASKTISQQILNNSTSLFDISIVENYVLENKLDSELNAYKKQVQEFENALLTVNKSIKEADKYLAMEAVTINNSHSDVQKEENVNVETKELDPFEKMKNQAEQISSRDDCYWSIIELTTEKMIIGFISNSLLLDLKWKPFDEQSMMSNILDITIRSRLKADVKDLYLRIAHDYCLYNLKPELLKVSYTRYKDVIEMINFVYDEVNSILFMVEDLRILSRKHIMKIQRDKFTIKLNSDDFKEIHKITIKIKPIEMIVPNDITVERILGRAEQHKIRDNAKFVKRDKTFFKMLIQDLKSYLNIVSNN